MASVFTEHVRHFNSASDPVDRVLPELEKLLRQRMRRRNLLTAPPSYLGYEGKSWDTPGAFADIVADCYLFAILERRPGLLNQLRIKPNVDGLVIRNVDNFLGERQQHADPVGYTIFANVRDASEVCEDLGELSIEGRNKDRIHKSSVLRLDSSRPDADAVQIPYLETALEQAAGWNEALASLVANSRMGVEWVAGFLRELRTRGVVAIRCGDLVNVLASRARADWASRHAIPKGETAREGDLEFGELVRIVSPNHAVDDRDRWEKLKMDVCTCIDGLKRQQRVKERLTQVFNGMVHLIEEGDFGPPKQTELIDILGIPRATVSDDFRLLKGILEQLLRENPEA